MNRPAPAPVPTPTAAAWQADLGRRFWRHLALKFIGISGFMWLFFLGYFHTLRHPAYPVLEMPLTALDRLIPFQPQALLAYVSLWLYVGIAPGLLLSLRELVVYGLWAAALCLAGLACFYFWPTAVPPRTVDVTGLPGFALLQGVDAAGNACPSLHVATAIFTAIWIQRLLRIVQAPAALRWFNGAWFATIAYSTVAIGQHVVLDVLGGGALGALFAAASIRWNAGVGQGRPR
jgi:membrane-associated phospholipid phosphatase